MVDLRVTDEFHFFRILNVIDLALYLFVCIKFTHIASKIPFAFNLGLMLQWVFQTALGENGWPRGWYTNSIILCLFAAFFYIINSKLWASVFLLAGLMFINPVWEGFRLELERLLSRSISMSVNASEHGVIFFTVLFSLAIIAFISFISRNRYIQIGVVAFTASTKFMSAIKGLFISKGTIICSAEEGSRMCPFWFNGYQWIAVAGLCAFRLMLLYYVEQNRLQFCCKKHDYNAVRQDDPDNTNPSSEVQVSDQQSPPVVAVNRSTRPQASSQIAGTIRPPLAQYHRLQRTGRIRYR